MKAIMNPRSITPVEAPYLNLLPSQKSAVAEQLLEVETPAQVRGLFGWLDLRSLGIESATPTARTAFRKILRDRAPKIPPPLPSERRLRRVANSERGAVALGSAVAGAAAGAALFGHPIAAVVGSSLYIMGNPGDELERALHEPLTWTAGRRVSPRAPHVERSLCVRDLHLVAA